MWDKVFKAAVSLFIAATLYVWIMPVGVPDESPNGIFVSPTFDVLRSSTFTVATTTGHGSGFVLKDYQELLITCAHVVAEHTTVLLMDSDEIIWFGEVGFSDEKHDVAIIVLQQKTNAVGLEFGTPKLGMDVYVCGAPILRELHATVTKGIVSGFRTDLLSPEHIQVDAALNPGNSGGPAVDTEGRIIGMAQAHVPRGEGLGLLVPAHVIERILNDYLESL